MTHRNARLTPVTGAELVQEVERGWPPGRSGLPVPRLTSDRGEMGAALPKGRTRWAGGPHLPAQAIAPADTTTDRRSDQ